MAEENDDANPASRLWLTAVLAAVLCALAPAPAAGELVVNGDFSAGQAPWWLSNVTADTDGGVFNVAVPAVANPWEAIVGQGGFSLSSGSLYTLTFDAWASAPATVPRSSSSTARRSPAYFNTPVVLTTSTKTFSYTFTSPVTDPAAVLQFQLGANPAFTFHLDNVSLHTTVQRVANGDFCAGQAPWWLSNVTADTGGGIFNVAVPAVANPWEAIVGQGGLPWRPASSTRCPSTPGRALRRPSRRSFSSTPRPSRATSARPSR